MPSSSGHETPRVIERLAGFVRRRILWLLLGCYILATVLPGPGLAIRNMELSKPLIGDVRLSMPLLLLATLLFCAAILTNLAQLRTVMQRPAVLVLGLIGVWLASSILVAGASIVVPWAVGQEATVGLLVGLALVATMPVANSSVGWSQSAGGNLALSLGLVFFSISLSPWVTPHLLQLLGLSFSSAERAYAEQLVTNFSGTFFIVWVIMPTLLGIVCRGLLGQSRVRAAAAGISVASATALLLLNYSVASLAFPKVIQQPDASVLAITVFLATALSTFGLAFAWLLAKLLASPGDARSALFFGLSMKHTGLALLLANEVLAEQPLALLMIALTTLMQHLLAGIVQWMLQHNDNQKMGKVSDKFRDGDCRHDKEQPGNNRRIGSSS